MNISFGTYRMTSSLGCNERHLVVPAESEFRKEGESRDLKRRHQEKLRTSSYQVSAQALSELLARRELSVVSV